MGKILKKPVGSIWDFYGSDVKILQDLGKRLTHRKNVRYFLVKFLNTGEEREISGISLGKTKKKELMRSTEKPIGSIWYLGGSTKIQVIKYNGLRIVGKMRDRYYDVKILEATNRSAYRDQIGKIVKINSRNLWPEKRQKRIRQSKYQEGDQWILKDGSEVEIIEEIKRDKCYLLKMIHPSAKSAQKKGDFFESNSEELWLREI